MTDWADEIEDEIFANAPHESGTPWTGDIAAALRKAKADGMREAAAMLDGDGKWNCEPSCLADDLAMGWAKSIRETASKLSPT